MVVLTGCESLLDVPESHENFCAQLQSPSSSSCLSFSLSVGSMRMTDH